MANLKVGISILNDVKNDLKKESIHIYTQIITNQFVLLLSAIFVFIFILVTLAVQTIIEQTSKFNYDNLHYINNETDDFFIQLKEDLHYITSNQEIRSSIVFSNQFEDGKNPFKIHSSTTSYINYLLELERSYELTLFNLNGPLKIRPDEINESYKLKSEKWYNHMIDNDISEMIVSKNVPGYYNDSKNEEVISYIIAIKNFTESNIIGFISLDIPYKTINDLYTKKISPTYPIIILDENDNMIFHTDSLNEEMINTITTESQYFVKETKLKIGKEKYLVSKWTSDFTKWKIMSIISITKQLGPFTKLAIILTPVIVIIILLHTIITHNTSKKIIRPINDLITTMKNTRKGYFNQEQLPSTNIFEIDELAYTFKDMMQEITRLIDTNQKSNLLKIESQLIALQQKINPHFLFNTLELISGQAIIESAYSTSEMAQKLGNLFRYNLRAPDVLSLEQELNYFQDYLYLQQIRYNNTLNVTMTIDNSILKNKIPKLTLQPIVENSIMHGFCDLPSDEDSIHIKGYIHKDHVVIDIIDNGSGISDRKVKEINNALINDTNNFQHFINRKDHIGIRNVNARICLYYKTDNALLISNTDGRTKITITFPQLRS